MPVFSLGPSSNDSRTLLLEEARKLLLIISIRLDWEVSA